MLKFLSCALVLFSSTFLGFLKAADFEKREKILRCFISDLEFIKNEITHLKTPIFEVLQKLGNSNGETGAFYREVAEKFVQNKDMPLSEIFDAETDKINEYFPLKKKRRRRASFSCAFARKERHRRAERADFAGGKSIKYAS